MTTRMPSICFPTVRPPFKASNATKYPRNANARRKMTSASTHPTSASPGPGTATSNVRSQNRTRIPRPATIVSTMPAAAREPRPARSTCSATCSGVSIPNSWRSDVSAGCGSRAGTGISTSYRHPMPGASPSMADIRPMNFGEILDGSLVMYRRYFGLFFKLAAVVLAVPVVLLLDVSARWLGVVLTRTQDPTAALSTLAWIFPIGIVYYLARLVLTAGTVRIISDAYLGRTPRLQDALSLGLSKMWGLVGVGLGKFAILLLCMVAVGIVFGVLVVLAKALGAVGVLLMIAAGGAGVWFVVFAVFSCVVSTLVVVW